MHRNIIRYTIKDLKRCREAILLRLKLENFKGYHEYGGKLRLPSEMIKDIIWEPESCDISYLYTWEVDFLLKCYKPHLPKLTKTKLLKSLGFSTKTIRLFDNHHIVYFREIRI